jgi:hypothetical protein
MAYRAGMNPHRSFEPAIARGTPRDGREREEKTMLKPIATLTTLIAATALTIVAALVAATALLALAAPAVHAAGLSPNLSIHTTGPNGTTTIAGRTNPYPSYTAPPYYPGGPRGPRGTTSFSSNSQFDDPSGNLNPGGGGGGGSGTTPVKKPNLQ